MSAETWIIIAAMVGTGAAVLVGMVGVMLKLWSDTNKRLDRQSERIEELAVGLRAEIHALRTENNQRFAQIEQRFVQIEQRLDRQAERQHADINAVNARLDTLLLSQGNLAAALTSSPGDDDEPPDAARREPVPASQSTGA